MPFITQSSLKTSLSRLKSTADHMFKIWLTLKQMGLTQDNPIIVNTSNSEAALQRLFGYGSPANDFFVPFAHTRRFQTMKGDASRSIIQTNLVRWAVSNSVVSLNPTSYLDLERTNAATVEVRLGRYYPRGLGHGKNGFALEEDSRVSLPLLSFCVWYYRQVDLPEISNIASALKSRLMEDLNLTLAELELVTIPDDPAWQPMFGNDPLTDQEVFEIVNQFFNEQDDSSEFIVQETYKQHLIKVNSMVTLTGGPTWLRIPPETQLNALINGGAKAILLYGPPRTGKTQAIDTVIPRDNPERETIQIHDGWGYDELIMGLRPQPDGNWLFQEGPLLSAIRANKTYIVLEEINRTDFSQAIGEVFSLIEESYRGFEHQIRLRNGDALYLPENLLIFCTMNTLDRATEVIDDALFGRMSAVEFMPRVESLHAMLSNRGIEERLAAKLRELFATIQQYYPLGHGYFAEFRSDSNPIHFYLNRLRPVLQKHLQNFRDQDLATIDERVDQLFGTYGNMANS